MTTTRSLLATTVRWANVIYDRLPDDVARDRFATLWLELEREIETAEAMGDGSEVVNVVARWRDSLTSEFPEVTR